jgi:membrane protein
MRTMKSRLSRGLEQAGDRAEVRETTSHAATEPLNWKDVLKGVAAVWVANAAQKVLHRQAATPVAGRKGGEVAAAAVAPATVVMDRPRDSALGRDRKASTEEAEHAVNAGPWETAKLTFKEFGADNGTLLAAAVAFYFILSVIPLGAVAVSIFGFVLHGQPGAQDTVYRFMEQFFPGQGDLLRTAIQKLVEARGAVAGVGLLGLLLTATGGFSTLETAINVTWRTPNRNFLWNKLFALGMMLVIGMLFFLSFGMTAVVQFAEDLPVLGWLAKNWGLKLLGLVLPFVIGGVMFSFIFRFFPNVKNREWKPSLIAGFTTALFWEVFKQGYTWYSAEFLTKSATATYGTLGGFIGLIMWIYYSCALVLLGSELTWVLEGCPQGAAKQPAAAEKR